MDRRFAASWLHRGFAVGAGGLLVRVVKGGTLAAILLYAPLAHANATPGVPDPNPNVAPDPGSSWYVRGY